MTRHAELVTGAITFFVPGKLRNPLNGAHGHWATAAKERQRWRWKTKLAFLALPTRKVFPLDYTAPKRVWLIAHTWNAMDTDGLVASLKSVRDGLMDCGLIRSDAPEAGNVFTYEQRVKRKERGVWITVETL